MNNGHHQSRGMPPIFGFLGKVTAKGKKALVQSIILLILNVIFLSCCAYAFVAIENNEKFKLKRLNLTLGVQGDLQYFLSNVSYHLPGHTPWTDEEWGQLKDYHSTRCFKLDNAHTQNNLWNFWSALDFSATVLTTIGYGSMSPRTGLGKGVCVFYFLIGVPLMASYLALFSKGICALTTLGMKLFSNIMGSINKSFKLSDMTMRMFSLIVLLLGLFAYICMWSGILTNSNPADSFIKCMYFYVITLTTVGLGDISMTEAKPFVLIRVLFVFCVGLTLVTAVFNAIRSVTSAHTRMLKAKGRRLTTKAQEVMMKGENMLKKHQHKNGDGQTEPLTKDMEGTANGDKGGMIETTFMAEEEREYDYNRHNPYDMKNFPYE